MLTDEETLRRELGRRLLYDHTLDDWQRETFRRWLDQHHPLTVKQARHILGLGENDDE